MEYDNQSYLTSKSRPCGRSGPGTSLDIRLSMGSYLSMTIAFIVYGVSRQFLNGFYSIEFT